MKIPYDKYNSFVNSFYEAKAYSLGELFCKRFGINDPELKQEKNEEQAIDIIMERYVGSDTNTNK